jgi:hypothetical protein
MSESAARESIARELQQALARLHQDIARVEFWADALGGFSQPVPDYDVTSSRLNQYMLPHAPPRMTKTARADDNAAPSNGGDRASD